MKEITPFVKISLTNTPRGHDSGLGEAEIYLPGTSKDYEKLEYGYPTSHPHYTEQTDSFLSSISPMLPRDPSEEVQFQLLNKKYNITREQFEKMKHISPMFFAKSASIDKLVEKIKDTETVEQIIEDEDLSDQVPIEITDLGNGALAETLPDGTILIDEKGTETIDDFTASRLVHELSHHIDWKDQNYLDKPEEKKAFQFQVQFLLEKGYSTEDIAKLLLPIFEDYKTKEEAISYFTQMVEDAKSNLNSLTKVAKVTRIHLTFSPEEKAILDKVQKAASKLGIKVFLAGGLIRDRLLGVPNSDLDFVTNHSSEALARSLANTYQLNDPVKMDRSGATMLFLDRRFIDLIDAKRVFAPMKLGGTPESLEQGQEAEMSLFTDDAYRRDLTINSLMYGLSSGKLYDPTGKGLSDLKNKIIRTIIDPVLKYRVQPGDMLRALRFYATKPGFRLAPDMLYAMKINVHRLLPRQRGGQESSRRIERELRKCETAEEWNKCKAALAEIGAYKYIGDEIKAVDEDKKGNIEYDFNEKK
jgi:hypothetical protein